MSREGARRETTAKAGTHVGVWVIYGLGILAAAVFVFSVLFTAGAYLLSEDVPVTYDVSPLAVVVWGALIALAAGTWLWRRRRR
jgi:hypothetical protein